MALTYDNASGNAHPSASTTLTWSHTIGSGSDRMLIVGVYMRVVTVSGITYNGVALTKIRNDKPGGDVNCELWYMPEANLPSTGAYNIVVTGSASQQWAAGAVSYSDCSGLGANNGTSGGASTSSTVSVTTAVGNVVINAVSLQSANASLGPSGSETERDDQITAVGRGGMSTFVATGTSTAMGWSFGSDFWATSSVVLQPTVSDFTRGNYSTLPTVNSPLETSYSAQDVTDVSSDNSVRVAQSATGEYMIHQSKHSVGAGQTYCTVTWNGQTDLAPSTSTVFLQIHNQSILQWETIDSDSTSSAGTDFTLTALVPDLTDYIDGDSKISCRVYQLAT